MKHYSPIRSKAAPNTAIAPQSLLGQYDSHTAELLKTTTSEKMPTILDGGRRELERLIRTEGTNKDAFADYLFVIERTAVACVKNAMLPLDLRGPVVFANDCKRADGQPGSESRRHYRELGQIRKATGRFLTVANTKMWVANMYIAICEYLDITTPQTLPLDADLATAIDQLWDLGKDELKWPDLPNLNAEPKEVTAA